MKMSTQQPSLVNLLTLESIKMNHWHAKFRSVSHNKPVVTFHCLSKLQLLMPYLYVR